MLTSKNTFLWFASAFTKGGCDWLSCSMTFLILAKFSETFLFKIYLYIYLIMKLLISLWGLFICPFVFSQILTVNPGSSVSISSGSSINLDGLEIAPAGTYVISGSNDVSRSITAATAGGNNSILRVYNTSALLSGFTGTLIFSYLDGELNGIAEGDLVMELQADDDSRQHMWGLLIKLIILLVIHLRKPYRLKL